MGPSGLDVGICRCEWTVITLRYLEYLLFIQKFWLPISTFVNSIIFMNAKSKRSSLEVARIKLHYLTP